MGDVSGKYCMNLFTWDGCPSSRWIVEHLLGRGPCVQITQSTSHKFSFRGHRVEHVEFLDGVRAHADGLRVEVHTNYVIVTSPVDPTPRTGDPHEIMVLLTEHISNIDDLGPGNPITPIARTTACDIARVLGCFKNGADDKTCAEAAYLWVHAMTIKCPVDADSRSRFATGVIKTIAHNVLKPLIDHHMLTLSSSVDGSSTRPKLQRYQSEYARY